MEKALSSRIYLDNAATTTVDSEVEEAMRNAYKRYFGNPSSLHSAGMEASEMLEGAREKLARLMGADPAGLVFTGSGTEANNLALKGVAFANKGKPGHIIVSSIEHDCILRTAAWLGELGFSITNLPVDGQGIVNPDDLRNAITPATLLVSVMHVNNEIGSIQPIEQIGGICRENKVIFHTDACQSFGKISLDAEGICADLITVNAHKIHGPKGAGALWIKPGTKIQPLLHGGGQEKGIRSSTENIPGILGFARASEIACSNMEAVTRRLSELQEHIVSELHQRIPNIYFNGSLTRRIPHNINFCIEGLEGEGIKLQLLLDEAGVCVSTGSACSSNNGSNPSHVLQAIGLDPFQARGGIRISMGRYTTRTEVDRFLEIITEKTRQLKPIF